MTDNLTRTERILAALIAEYQADGHEVFVKDGTTFARVVEHFDFGASLLAEVNLTRLAIRRGTWLRGYAYGFIETFAPTLTREAVDKALAEPHLNGHFAEGDGI